MTEADSPPTARHLESGGRHSSGRAVQSPSPALDFVRFERLRGYHERAATRILRKVREAITDEGRILVMEMVLSDESPPFAPWLDVHMLMMVDGKERTEAEFATLMDEAGFRLNRVVATACTVSIIEGLPVSG